MSDVSDKDGKQAILGIADRLGIPRGDAMALIEALKNNWFANPEVNISADDASDSLRQALCQMQSQ